VRADAIAGRFAIVTRVQLDVHDIILEASPVQIAREAREIG
jgi:hypothetical protein